MRKGTIMKNAGTAAVAFTLLSNGSVYAETMPKWKTVAGWDIHVDTTLNYGCFLFSEFESGTVLRIGFDRKSGNAYLLVGNRKWASLEEGKEYEIKIQFDSEKPWAGPAKAIRMGEEGTRFLTLDFSSADFLKEFQSKHVIRLMYKGRSLARLSLKGSSLATTELIRCQTNIEEVRRAASGESADPFDSRSRRVRTPRTDDPFRD